MSRVGIVDYGMGNLDSVARALQECGAEPLVVSDPSGLLGVSHIILPGVGSFGDGMRNLRARGFEPVLRTCALQHGVPLLGICLGMQLLASRGSEGEERDGLDIIPGEVRPLVPDSPTERLPHVGWNEVRETRPSPLLSGIAPGSDFYFVHSYHVICRFAADVLATSPYCGGFASAVNRGRVWGVQFHPEKSQRKGFQLLRNFLVG